MSLLWCWVEALHEAGPMELATEEARHVSARRLRIGDELVVFDGRGRHASARIESLGRRDTVVQIESISETLRPRADFVLASAIPKGDRLSTMLQMLSQLGLATWQPLVLDESVVRKLDPKASRIERILIESCKVARRPWRLEVLDPCSLDEALARRAPGASISFGDREGDPGGIDDAPGLMLIGPEAGFSESERRLLQEAGGRPRSLAPYNLRIETAAIAAAATVAARLPGARADLAAE